MHVCQLALTYITILKYVSAIVLCQDAPVMWFLFLSHVYKSFLNVLIEQRPTPRLNLSGRHIFFFFTILSEYFEQIFLVAPQ